MGYTILCRHSWIPFLIEPVWNRNLFCFTVKAPRFREWRHLTGNKKYLECEIETLEFWYATSIPIFTFPVTINHSIPSFKKGCVFGRGPFRFFSSPGFHTRVNGLPITDISDPLLVGGNSDSRRLLVWQVLSSFSKTRLGVLLRSPSPQTVNSGLGIAHPNPCVVRRLSVALPVSLITGYTDPIATAACSGRSACCGGIANLTMRTCRKRSRGNHTFGTAQDSRQVCLFHLARGHAETILAKRTTRYARARPPLRTPPLRDTSQSPLPTQRTFEDSHTSHLPTQTAQDRP